MPHVIIEHDIDNMAPAMQQQLMHCAAEVVRNSGLFDASNIKVRLHTAQSSLLPAGVNGYLHVQCRIHQGRSDEQKRALSESLVAGLSQLDCGVSVMTCEIVEMDSASYAKWLA